MSPKQRANLRQLSLHGAGMAMPRNQGDALWRRGWVTVEIRPMCTIYKITVAGRKAYEDA